MKDKFHRLFIALALLALVTLNSQLSTAFAQGALTPTGAPAPTMKTLAQIEPRTPISSAPFTISQPGSYYLTTNLNVTTGDVTLDLNGFTVSSTAPSATGTGIMLAGGNNDITILNGHIKGGVTNDNSGVFGGSGFANGILYSGTLPSNVRVTGVTVAGCLDYGIVFDDATATTVESCTVEGVGSFGIEAAVVTHSCAYLCGNHAVVARSATDCYGYCMGPSGYGVYTAVANNCYGYANSIAVNASTANNCFGQSAASYGVNADAASGCEGISSSGTGLSATYTATGCYGFSSSGTGLFAYAANNCYGQTSSSFGYGLNTVTANNSSGVNSSSGIGLYANHIAIGCYGLSSGTIGLQTTIANSCDGNSVSSAYHYNMPPSPQTP
jgi:hypothetical protein